jgi:biopolymer transport protein ExbD
MVTTMDKEEGIARQLPPIPPEDQKVENQEVNRRNIIQVKINSNDRLLAGGVPMDVSQLKDKIKEFMTNPNDDPNLPEKEVKEVKGIGPVPVSKGVISLQNDRGTTYQAYITVQNELVKAINEIRDDFSMRTFGKKYAKLDEEQQNAVREAVPQRISEAEPKDVKKR